MLSRWFPLWSKLKALKTHGRLMWHAFRHRDTPMWIKGFMVAVLVYLLSPIDLVPDFLLWFGFTDDLIVVTLAVWILGKIIPDSVKLSAPGQAV